MARKPAPAAGRYWAGRAPEWAADEDDDVESGAVFASTARVAQETTPARPQRVKREAEVVYAASTDTAATTAPRSAARDEEDEDDAAEHERRRARARELALQREREEQAAAAAMMDDGLFGGDEEEEEDALQSEASEYTTASESEEESAPALLMKPVFVRKYTDRVLNRILFVNVLSVFFCFVRDAREMMAEAERLALEEAEFAEREAERAELRKLEAKKQLQEILQKELNEADMGT